MEETVVVGMIISYLIGKTAGHPPIQIKRKQPDGTITQWNQAGAKPRVRMARYSYLDRELIATTEIERAMATMEKRAAEEPEPAATVGAAVVNAMQAGDEAWNRQGRCV